MSINMQNLVLNESLIKTTSTGFQSTKNFLESTNIKLISNNINRIMQLIVAISFYIVSGICYYTLISINPSSEMIQYIAFSIYAWLIMLGLIIILIL